MCVEGIHIVAIVKCLFRKQSLKFNIIILKNGNFSNSTGGSCLLLPQTGYGPDYCNRRVDLTVLILIFG